ncbi:sentrin-specific protease 1 [Rhodotorula toruloides]|uniref:Sentrin-specific protease 1 n=1 Tax=Rhodotorula toruloides TaxID=5286 RepID=A0A511KG69_RHOTO|nr:sentrin-specific protease 1 [Rhodotorula toruloides]
MPSLKRPLSADSPDVHRSPDRRSDAAVLRGASPSSNKRVRRDDIEQDSSPADWVYPWSTVFTQGLAAIKSAAKSAFHLATASTSNSQTDLRASRRLPAPTTNAISPPSHRELKQLRQEYQKIRDELIWHRMEARARGSEVSKDSAQVFDLNQQLKALKLKIEGGDRAQRSTSAMNGRLLRADASPARAAGGSNALANGAPGTPGLLGGFQRKKPMGSDKHKADLAIRDRATVDELRRDAQLRKAASTNDVRIKYRGLDFAMDDDDEVPEAEDALEERVYRQKNEEMLQQEDAKLGSKQIKLRRARAGETARQHRIPLTTSLIVRPSALDRSTFFPSPSAFPTKNSVRPSKAQQGRSRIDYTLRQAKKTLNEPTLEALERYEQMQKELKELNEKAELELEVVKQKKREFPKVLSAEHQARAKAIFANRAYDVSMKGGAAAHRDIIRLKDRTWLNDEIVNFYGAMINARSDEADKREAKEGPKARGEGVHRLRKAFCFNTHFWNMFGDQGFSKVKRWTKRFDTFEKDIIIIPINHNNSHWVCAAVNIALKRFEYYDSLGNPSAFVYDRLRRWLFEEHKSKKGGKEIDLSEWENFWMDDVPQQTNADDCGVFTCMFMESLSRDVDGFDFKQKDMPYIRHRIAIEIDQQKLLDLEPWV